MKLNTWTLKHVNKNLKSENHFTFDNLCNPSRNEKSDWYYQNAVHAIVKSSILVKVFQYLIFIIKSA
jgi:hypothetical protein